MKTDLTYVVTRNGRRIEQRNYTDKADAAHRARSLRELLRKWKDPDRFKILVKSTNKPHQVR